MPGAGPIIVECCASATLILKKSRSTSCCIADCVLHCCLPGGYLNADEKMSPIDQATARLLSVACGNFFHWYHGLVVWCTSLCMLYVCMLRPSRGRDLLFFACSLAVALETIVNLPQLLCDLLSPGSKHLLFGPLVDVSRSSSGLSIRSAGQGLK